MGLKLSALSTYSQCQLYSTTLKALCKRLQTSTNPASYPTAMYSPLQESETAVIVLALSINLLIAGLTVNDSIFKFDGAGLFAILDGGKQWGIGSSAPKNNIT